MAHTILLIEDDPTSQALVKFGLAEKKYVVITAEDGEEGLVAAQEKKPNLIVCDVQMPRMNGYEFMTELKKHEDLAQIPVIMLTGNETMQQIFQMEGVQGYFVKPVNLPELREKIVAILGENPI